MRYDWVYSDNKGFNPFAADYPAIFQIPPVPGQIGQYNV